MSSASTIELPVGWAARPYQRPLMKYLFEGEKGTRRKRSVCVWHRRAGKDSVCLQIGAIATQQRVGTYWHMLPTLAQARKVIWFGIDKNGRRMIDQAFPHEMRESTNISEMKIVMKNGSIWQCVGSDNYDTLVGANPLGVIFSEFSIADPLAWDYLRPVLAENHGWAMFIYTPRGKNHGYTLAKMAKKNPKWFYSELSVEDTLDARGNRFVPQEVIDEEIEAGMSREKVQQEFYVSWDAGLEGAYYTNELNNGYKEGRIKEGCHPWDPTKRVFTYWDIGIRDRNCIIFVQHGDDGNPIIIDYLEGRNRSCGEWIHEVRSLPYDYAEHWGPHDLENREYSTGKTRIEFAEGLNFYFNIVPKIPMADGIDATRAMLRKARFNKDKVINLLEALSSYRKEYDDKTQLFKDKPLHDWASHGADAMRYLSIAWNPIASRAARGQQVLNSFKVKRTGDTQQSFNQRISAPKVIRAR